VLDGYRNENVFVETTAMERPRRYRSYGLPETIGLQFARYSRPVFRERPAMHLAMLTTFAASRQELLVSVVEQIPAGLVTAGFGDPSIRFTFSDGPMARASSVGRALERFCPNWYRPESLASEQV
jgi:hypothetical protein